MLFFIAFITIFTPFPLYTNHFTAGRTFNISPLTKIVMIVRIDVVKVVYFNDGWRVGSIYVE